MEIEVTHYTLEDWTRFIEHDVPFSLSRWGDGEWSAVVGDDGINCDGHEYFPALRDDLRKALRRNLPYFKGWLAVSRNVGRERIAAYLEKLGAAISWVNGDTMLDACVRGELAPLVAVLRPRRVLYVGPAPLAKLANVVGWIDAGFIEVPSKNAYLEKKRIREEIHHALGKYGADIVGFSAGMTTNVLIDELWPVWGERVTMIDFGSMFDIFCGVRSRSYNRRGNWDQLIRLNLGGRHG